MFHCSLAFHISQELQLCSKLQPIEIQPVERYTSYYRFSYLCTENIFIIEPCSTALLGGWNRELRYWDPGVDLLKAVSCSLCKDYFPLPTLSILLSISQSRAYKNTIYLIFLARNLLSVHSEFSPHSLRQGKIPL